MTSPNYELFYMPISIDRLRENSYITFELYMKVKDKLVLYKNRNLTITKKDLESLREHGVKELYIAKAERKKYRQYLEENLDKILNDPNVDIQTKANYLYESAVNVVEDIFEHPRSGENIKRAKNMVNHTVNFILSGPEAFLNLLKIRAHDYYTFTHSVNVCTFSVALAQKLGYKDINTLRELGIGALLHDVGKSKIDPKIINKPTKLDPHEWEEMKKHPIYGVEIVKETKMVPEKSLLIIEQHHEKMNGKGYPKGLKGREISLFGRIGTIVDVFDAITTSRSYSPAKPPIVAIKFMLEREEEFDHNILKNFIELITVKKT